MARGGGMINDKQIDLLLKHFSDIDPSVEMASWINPSVAVEIITRLRQAEKDAARYRCIKLIARVIECEEFEMDMLDGQDLDEMVDECIEAMQCK